MEAETSTPFSAEPFPQPSVSGPRRVAVSVPTDDSGKPDWSKVSPKVRKKFEQLFNDPATQAEFSSTPEGQIDPAQAKMLGMWAINILFQVEGLAVAAKFKLTREEAKTLTQADFSSFPDFDNAVTRIMQKRGPEWLAKWADEIYVGSCLLMAMAGNWEKGAEMAAMKKKREKENTVIIDVDSKPNGGYQEPVYQQDGQGAI